MKVNLGKEITENIHIVTTFLSPGYSNLGILIGGENFFEESMQPVIRIYLIEESETEWHIQKELEAFTFSNYTSAKRFVSDLPEMTALDMLLLMSGYRKGIFYNN